MDQEVLNFHSRSPANQQDTRALKITITKNNQHFQPKLGNRVKVLGDTMS